MNFHSNGPDSKVRASRINNHFSIADVIDKDEETRKIRQLIIDGISQECFQIDARSLIGYHTLRYYWLK